MRFGLLVFVCTLSVMAATTNSPTVGITGSPTPQPFKVSDLYIGGTDTLEIFVYPLIDFVIAFLLLMSLRFISGFITKSNSLDQLAVKDNFAFGVSLAGSCLGLLIMLHGAISGEAGDNAGLEFGLISTYGVMGVIIMSGGKLLLDIVVFRKIDIKAEVMNENMAAAILDVSNTLSSAILVWASMGWIETNEFVGCLVALCLFIVVQLILMVFINVHIWVFLCFNRERLQLKRDEHAGRLQEIGKTGSGSQSWHVGLEEHFVGGNQALAWRYFGNVVGLSFMTAAGPNLVRYDDNETIRLVYGICIIAGFSIAFCLLHFVLSFLARKLVLWGINLKQEVDEQRNVGVASVEAVVSIACGVLVFAISG